jgi:hypothetical protein
MAQQKKEWKAPGASRFGTFVEATEGVPNPGEAKFLGLGDEFAPSNLGGWTPIN